ncbi:IclR family transcriptional regulator [Rhizobium sp. AN80A]|uniref:IclR family transcriptional regulator n=1 Tax=Rhizobium sp. AN80A TaxID=3040673 RepID=UPI0024B37EB8|nr:IclR family transcriptional regulator [Rhizobium sp. AN80A]
MFRKLIGVSTFDPDEADKFADDALFVRAVARAVAVLSVFELAPKPLSLSEIAQMAGLDRSAAQRIVHTLVQLGMIVRDAHDTGYLPGKRILTMAYSGLRLNPICQKVTPALLELRRRADVRVDMSFWDDTRIIYAIRMPSEHELFVGTLTGHSVPVYCTSGGIAILARLPDEEIADIFARSDTTPFTPDTYTTLDQVMKAVEETRVRGHSISNRQLQRHEVAIAVAIMGEGKRPVGAITLGGSTDEFTPEEFSAKFGSLLEKAGESQSEYS